MLLRKTLVDGCQAGDAAGMLQPAMFCFWLRGVASYCSLPLRCSCNSMVHRDWS
jgi:hypothetical protein